MFDRSMLDTFIIESEDANGPRFGQSVSAYLTIITTKWKAVFSQHQFRIFVKIDITLTRNSSRRATAVSVLIGHIGCDNRRRQPERLHPRRGPDSTKPTQVPIEDHPPTSRNTRVLHNECRLVLSLVRHLWPALVKANNAQDHCAGEDSAAKSAQHETRGEEIDQGTDCLLYKRKKKDRQSAFFGRSHSLWKVSGIEPPKDETVLYKKK